MPEKIVVGFRATGALSQRGRGHLERSRALIRRAEACGGVLVGWSGLAVCFGFGIDRVFQVIELLSTPADDTLAGEEPWACAVAQGPLEPLSSSGTRGHLAWGTPLVTAMSLLALAEPGELLVCDSVKVPEREQLVGLGGRPALDAETHAPRAPSLPPLAPPSRVDPRAEIPSPTSRKLPHAMPPPLPSKTTAAALRPSSPPPLAHAAPPPSRAIPPVVAGPVSSKSRAIPAGPAAPQRNIPSRTMMQAAVPPLSTQSRTMVAVTAPKVALTPDEIVSLLLSSNSDSLEMLERVEGTSAYADRIRALGRIKKGDLHEAVRLLRNARANVAASDLSERCRTSLALGFALLASARPEEALLEACDALARAREKIDMRAENAAIGLITKIFDGSGRFADVRALKAWKAQGGQRAL